MELNTLVLSGLLHLATSTCHLGALFAGVMGLLDVLAWEVRPPLGTSSIGDETWETGNGLQLPSMTPGKSTFCPGGSYSTAIAAAYLSNCTSCNFGQYSTGIGATMSTYCQPCAAGTHASSLQYVSSCALCAAGTYSIIQGASYVGACTLCGAGTYSSIADLLCVLSVRLAPISLILELLRVPAVYLDSMV